MPDSEPPILLDDGEVSNIDSFTPRYPLGSLLRGALLLIFILVALLEFGPASDIALRSIDRRTLSVLIVGGILILVILVDTLKIGRTWLVRLINRLLWEGVVEPLQAEATQDVAQPKKTKRSAWKPHEERLLSDVFLIDPANSDRPHVYLGAPLPILKPVVRYGLTLVWALSTFLVSMSICILIMYAMILHAVTSAQLDRLGIEIVAQVLDCTIVDGRSTSYYWGYRFSLQGADQTWTWYSGKQRVSGWSECEAHPSAMITHYLPSDPTVSGDWSGGERLLFFVPPFTVVALCALILFKNRTACLRHNWPIETRGQLLSGEIVHARCFPTPHGILVEVRYSFLTPSGQKVLGTQYQNRNDLNEQTLPRPGTPLAILYAADNYFRAL